MTRLAAVRDILAHLVSFDTTSRDSNLALIGWVEDFLRPLGAELVRLPNEEGTKANLWARLGPDVPGGVVLSGHTDVVPVDGQPWTTNPFELVDADGRWHGRGTTDMKGFIALCLAHAEALSKQTLRRPVHFAFSYDEEIGCAGVAPMIAEIVARDAAPAMVWVGEPTSWGVVSGHKGIRDYEVSITGKPAHSSDPRLGASAIHEAVEIMSVVRRIAREAEADAPQDSLFDPPWTTLTIGEISGGTATNILARNCRFVFDIRSTGGDDPDRRLVPFFEAVDASRARLAPHGPECGVEIELRADAPGLSPDPDSEAERFMRVLTGDNSRRVAAYATEAGQFQLAKMPAVVCGPGSIEQAHQPNEFIAVSEIEKGLTIFRRFVEEMAR